MADKPPAPNIEIIPPGVTKWGGSSILYAHGCVLREHFTGKRYSYSAVNLKTGKTAHLCHRSKPITEVDHADYIARICASGIASDVRRKVDAKRGGVVPHQKLTETLTEIFETILPDYGYSLRPEQLELARHMLETLRRRAVSLSEAGVGIGKTHAYLIAAAMVKRGRISDVSLKCKYPAMAHITEMPVVIATSSIALQKAIALDYIPEISKILMENGVISKPLTCVVRKGKRHYICDKRLGLLWNQTTRDDIRQAIAPLFDKHSGIDLGDMDDIIPYIRRRINVAGRCGTSCSQRGSCRYMAFLNDAQSDKYDFQICNHNYLLADVKHRAKGQNPLIPNYQAIVIDEAHKLLAAARSMYGTELSSLTLPEIAKIIRGFVFAPGQSTAVLCRDTDRLTGQSERLFQLLRESIPDSEDCDDDAERLGAELAGEAERHLQTIIRLLDNLITELESRTVFQKYAGLYNHTLSELRDLRSRVAVFEKHNDLIYWLELPEDATSSEGEILLRAIPKKLSEMLHADLWGNGIPVILTSGTLSAAGDFTHVKKSLGLTGLTPGTIMETSKPSPFDYQENALIYISENVPFPNNNDPRYIKAVADEMERLIKAAHGHTVALFTSYRAMESVFELLKAWGVPFPLFMLSRGRLNTIEQFKQSGNGVLFATGSMWEGVDLPGDILSLLIIVKLPFAVPDPVSEYERTRYASMDEFKRCVVVPEMLIKLMQGFGRLIRTMRDTGVVAILDSRVREGAAYRGTMLGALPKCRVVRFIKAVTNFIRAKKPDAYFE